MQANNDAADELIPVKQKIKRIRASKDPGLVEAREKVNTAFKQYQENPTKDYQTKLQAAKENLQTAYNDIKEKELEGMNKKVEEGDSKSQHGESWKLINEISGRKTSKKGILKGKIQEKRIKAWYIHFSNLGKEPVTNNAGEEEITTVLNQPNIKTGPFTVREYQAVKRELKEDKTLGSDGISTEALNHCDFDDIIIKYANKLLIDQEKPDQWSDIHIIQLPKSGDLRKVGYYRGIRISSTISKVINRMILNCIQPAIEEHLRPNQNRFRPDRSTSSHILALHRIIEGVKQNKLPAVITFVNFRKAFDSVHCAKMMKILSAYGIPDELVKAISPFYENIRAKILSPDGDTEFFDKLAGVLQDDALAPYLFAFVIDYTIRQAAGDLELDLGVKLDKRRSRRQQPIAITDLNFADDIALLSEEIQKAQELLTHVENEAAKIGLCLNNEKTEVMVYNIPTPSPLKTIGDNAIKIVDNFKYLGSWMKSSEQDIKVRKALAWEACHKLSRVWRTLLKANIKVRLFLATLESVLLYGNNTWTPTKKLEQQLDGTYTRML